MSRRFCLILGLAMSMTGCKVANNQDSQYDDVRNPFYKQAQQDLDSNNPSAAAKDYEAALAANPKLPGAHYQLGILYSEKLQDPVFSIYHLKCYLALAPEADHAANAKELIEKENAAFAASLPNPAAQSDDKVSKLQADNELLRKQVDDAKNTITELQAQLAEAAKHRHDAPAPAAEPVAPADANAPLATAAAVAAAPTPTSTNAAPSGPRRALPLDSTNVIETPAASTAATDAGPSRSYTVVKGDSIWKIAHKMYPGDTKNGVDKIQDANKDSLGSKPLKIGQVLVIPQ